MFVLPSPDADAAVHILRERIGPWVPDGTPYFDFERYYVQHPCNQVLATVRVYTDGQTPGQSCDQLLQQLGLAAKDR